MMSWRSYSPSDLLRVFNDTANDSGDYVILVLLGLTAAFDTMDYNVLVARLLQLVGICGSALDGFRSYLADRTMCVNEVRLCCHLGSHKDPFQDHCFSHCICSRLVPSFRARYLCSFMLTEQSDLCATKEEWCFL